MEQYLPLILSAIGGGALGPLVTKLLGGNTTTGLLGGIIGGIAGHFGGDAAGIEGLLGSGIMSHIQDILEGAGGGGVLGVLAGVLLKKRG